MQTVQLVFFPSYQQFTFVLRFELLAFIFTTTINHMISKTKENNHAQQIGISRCFAVSAAVLCLAVWKYTLVTHFPTLFLNAYGRSQFELVLCTWRMFVWDPDLTLPSARSLNCEGLTRVSPACCGNTRPSRCFIP
jgi:hypothetical protein